MVARGDGYSLLFLVIGAAVIAAAGVLTASVVVRQHSPVAVMFLVATLAGLVVPLIDLLHKLVAQALCLALTWHVALRPRFGSFLTRGSCVVPVEKFPFGPKILQLGPLIALLLHHGPPSVVLQSRSLCSIKGGHSTTSAPERNWWMSAGRNLTYRPR